MGKGAHLTDDLLTMHNRADIAGPRMGSTTGASAAEILQWKRLVQQKERRQIAEDRDEIAGGKVTQYEYSASEAQRLFESAAKARQAQKRENYGSLVLGTRSPLP